MGLIVTLTSLSHSLQKILFLIDIVSRSQLLQLKNVF
jgi:hypothetical protein